MSSIQNISDMRSTGETDILLGYGINNTDRLEESGDASVLSQMLDTRGQQEDDTSGASKRKRKAPYITLGTLCALSVSAGLFVSLLAPFFSPQALKKGASQIEVGLIFGVFQLIVALTSPIFGRYMTQIGPKFMVVAGNFVCSGCAILFGILEWCPPGKIYIIMCFVTRSLEALGAAANFVAIYAIAAHTFPERIATVMGLLESSSCVGLMIGPPIGGALYAAGGFYLPFAVSGGIFMLFSFVCVYVLPSTNEEDEDEGDEESDLPEGVTRWSLLARPLVLASGILILTSAVLIGFMDVTLAGRLQEIREQQGQQDLSELYVGLVFLLPALIAAVLTPLLGYITDKHDKLVVPVLLISAAVMCATMLTIGPSPFIHFVPKDSLWLTVLSVGLSALGTCAIVVSYQQLVLEARETGLPDTLATQGIISGINGFFTSFGSSLGPTVGGILIEEIGFPGSTSIIAALAAFSLLFFLAALTLRCCGTGRSKAPPGESGTQEERRSLLGEQEPT